MGVRIYTRKKASGEVCHFWGYDFYDDNGQRHRLTNCKSKGEAETEYKKALKKLVKGERVRENKTLLFKGLAEDFLELHARVRCKEYTYKWYKRYINKHLIPFFGNIRVVNINPSLVNQFLAHKKEEERTVSKTIKDEENNKKFKEITQKKLSNETINHCLVILKAIFNKAVENETISKNPAENIKKLKIEKRQEMFILTKEEISILLNTAQNNYPVMLANILCTAIFTGMREGEILGLTKDSIDFKNKKIKVNKSVSEGKLNNTVKTSSSYRDVDMIIKVEEALKAQIKENKLLTPLIFHNKAAKPISVQNLLNRWFYPCVTKSGIGKKLRFHDLRHTYVSLLIAEGVPMKYIQHQVGHSSINVTMNTYGHLLPEVHENAVKALNNIACHVENIGEKKVI